MAAAGVVPSTWCDGVGRPKATFDTFAAPPKLRRYETAVRYLAAVLALIPTLAPDKFARSARKIDGDTTEISGQPIRLHGIDAPKARQVCR